MYIIKVDYAWKADPLLMKCVIFFGCFCRASGEIIEGHIYYININVYGDSLTRQVSKLSVLDSAYNC